jgi:geranylgeranyl pyrophosphate synthase
MKADKVKNIISKKLFVKNSFLEVTKSLIDESSVDYTKAKAKEHIKKAEKEMQIFAESQSKNLLLVMASMILTNKYFFALRNFHTKCDIAELETGYQIAPNQC